MSGQNYKNHVRWYTAHHFVFYPLALVLMVWSVYQAIQNKEQCLLWLTLAAVVALVAWLSFMLRQHYGMRLQDRLVLLELRYRYFVVTGERFEPLEKRLSFGQNAALRFASDRELPALARRAVDEKLSGTDIKKAVTDWKADNGRI